MLISALRGHVWLSLAAAALVACGRPSEPGSSAGPSPSPDPIDAAAPSDAAVPPAPAAECLAEVFVQGVPVEDFDYDQYGPAIGSHCRGTNHQDIDGVERVVFLGDSVTVGTPPTDPRDSYRARLADYLADRFEIEPPSDLWKLWNPSSGTSVLQSDGAFSSCAKWGARVQDLPGSGGQIESCFPLSERGKKTLVIITIGGNDLKAILEAGADGVPLVEIWEQTEAIVEQMREAVRWFYEPSRFANGVYVIFANFYEFTDATGDTSACPAADLSGVGDGWSDVDKLAAIVAHVAEQFMALAVETGADMVFLLEHFCGHGYNRDNPGSPCYDGVESELWFDVSCTHPTAEGHSEIFGLFRNIVEE